jgi:hypothetical protein
LERTRGSAVSFLNPSEYAEAVPPEEDGTLEVRRHPRPGWLAIWLGLFVLGFGGLSFFLLGDPRTRSWDLASMGVGMVVMAAGLAWFDLRARYLRLTRESLEFPAWDWPALPWDELDTAAVLAPLPGSDASLIGLRLRGPGKERLAKVIFRPEISESARALPGEFDLVLAPEDMELHPAKLVEEIQRRILPARAARGK